MAYRKKYRTDFYANALPRWFRCVITRVLMFWFLTIMSFMAAQAQNLESMGKKGEMISVSGGLNLNQVAYMASGVEGRRDPYNYFLSGNLNIGLYGWSVPLSFSYSNQNASFQQPFNQYGMSPTYKWVTAHIGYRSMNFSKYTLAGHQFLGGGVELQPTDKIKVAAMYGRLQKAVQIDTANVNTQPAYRRMGGGAKVTIGSSANYVDLSFFKAADEVGSVYQQEYRPVNDTAVIDTTLVGTIEKVSPEENFVLGIGFMITPLKGLSINGEFANSAISTDIRSERVSSGKVYDGLDVLFAPRVSSSYYQAMNGRVQYQFDKYTFGVAYERVEPGYRTLGAYYFNSDLESISVTHASTWLNQKLGVNLQLGMQRNNLDDTELNAMNRFSGAVSASFQVNERITTAFNYSNFSTVVNFRPAIEVVDQLTPYDNLDTLNYRQVAQNAATNINFILNESKDRRQNLSCNFSYQQTDDLRGGESQNTGSKFYNVNSAYVFNQGEKGLTFNIAGNMNMSRSPNAKNMVLGPSASVRKGFFDNQVSSTMTLSYNTASLNGKLSSQVINVRLGGNYTLKESHQFSLNITALNRFSPQNEASTRFSELVAELGYNYNFSKK